MRISRMALVAALALGGASVVASEPADAQRRNSDQAPAPAAAPPQREFNFSRDERTALAPVQEAVVAKNWPVVAAALPAARAAAKSSDAKYAVAQFHFLMGLGLNDVAMQAAGIDELIASGGVLAPDLPELIRNQASLASSARNFPKAEASYARLLEMAPTDTAAMIELAKIKAETRKPQEAIALLERAIAGSKAAGQPAPESWYKFALKLAYDRKLVPQSLKVGRDLVAAYPTKENWRDALLIFRELVTLDKPASLDARRLMRAAGALNGERDWYDLAAELDAGGLPAEAKAVLEEGSRLGMVDLRKDAFRTLLTRSTGRIADDRAGLADLERRANANATGTLALDTGEAYLGYGNYAKAAALFRTALQKGSIDANVANTRLGMALALAGNRAEAETALRAVTGPRAEIATYWLLWLSQQS